MLLALCAPLCAQTKLARIEGKNFVAPDGTILHLKGISLGNWLVPEGYMFKFKIALAPREIYGAFDKLLGPERAAAFWRTYRDTYIGPDDISFIKSVGFNVVRIPLHYDLFMTETGDMTGEGWALLDRVLGWVQEAGLYAILDLHAAPGGQTGVNHDDGSGYPLMFYVPRDRELTIKFWRAMAEHYAGNPAILGYDVLNEPIAPHHDVATLNPRLEPFYRDVTAAIREVDPGRIVILAGGQWSSSFDMLGRPFAPNLAYTYHLFWGSTERDSIQRHLNFSNRYNVPLFLGETGELTDDWNEAFRKLHEANGIGWSFWTYKNLDTTSTVVSIPRPDGWDDIADFADGRRSDRPAPEVVDRAIAQYLDGIQFRHGVVRWSYLASLGLKATPPTMRAQR
ncbi:Cellulase (glycosyl hydrolase family 5) [Enhydrobacter aerosaccus]|uniref:Exo-1,3-beta-glucanase D n=1 Tax=Enhydrobacter aerosaccus TaxID=225324 RepID=A0A1T4R3H1_9HYPH|nr:cellulase family glycosylhydrolase [Enhydrobacter aerosaccus]SKA10446.1 Cellulase (glycosyl hydrolase family 5) [Enhydrobacter aerosaccus]